MKRQIPELERYLHDVLGIEARTAPWLEAEQLPHFLRERYRFARTDLLGTPCVLAIHTSTTEESPATIRKHLDRVREKQPCEVIYVRDQVTAYNRKRLIEQKVSFIVPGNQMYLPMLAIDLREHFRRQRDKLSAFSPATQAVIIHALLRNKMDRLIPLDMARRLGYSPMTMTRAFDELEAAHLARTDMRGRERCLQLDGTRQEIWAKAQEHLRTPVSRRMFIPLGAVPVGVFAGLSALAEYSMLAPPAHPVLAVSREQWKKYHHEHKPQMEPVDDLAGREIQVWKYPPSLFAHKSIVDPLSLYLSLRDENDERTQASLEEMIRKLGW